MAGRGTGQELARAPVKFDSLQDEVKFLRAVVRVMRVTDEILEDCLENQLGVAAALDVFLAQAIRMVPASAGFVQVRGTRGPVITRVAGRLPVDVELAADTEGPLPVSGGHLYVRRLDIGSTRVGALGILLVGALDDERVMALVDTMAELLVRPPGTYAELWPVVERALEKEPELRYQTAEEMGRRSRTRCLRPGPRRWGGASRRSSPRTCAR